MRRWFATLLALVTGCGGGLTGRLNDDLSISAIEVRADSPATVRATLACPALLPDLIGLLESLDVRGVVVVAEMDEALVEAFDSAGYWLEIEPPGDNRSTVEVTIDLYGIQWTPEYSWTNGDSATMAARVRISNGTGQRLEADTVMVLDRDGTVLARAREVCIPRGGKTFPWWSSSGRTAGPIVCFGWPLPDRAQVMVAFFPDRPGPIIGMDSRNGMLPVYSGDTLWLPADDLLDLRQGMEQLRAGYSYTVRLTNLTDVARDVPIRYPAMLPRGARAMDPYPPHSLFLQPGQTDSTELVYEYPR